MFEPPWKEKAFERIVMEIDSRDPNQNCDRIVLMDGEPALEKKAKESVEWVRKYLTMILTGKVGCFIGAIRQIMSKREFSIS